MVRSEARRRREVGDPAATDPRAEPGEPAEASPSARAERTAPATPPARTGGPRAGGGAERDASAGRALSLRYRLLGGLLILLFLALFSLAIAVIVWLQLDLPPRYLMVALVVGIAADLVLLGLFADYRLRLLVLRPVEQMVEGAEEIAHGDETRRLPRSDTRELDRLCFAVNAMADRLIRNQRLLAENVKSLDETNRALTEAQKRLVRAEKLASIGRLAAGVAHEVGNPLGAIIGYVELGRRRGEADSDWLDGISHEASRIDRIVRGLLDYAKPKAAAAREVRVNEVVARTEGLMRIQGRFKRVRTRLDLDEDLPPVRADPHQLEQVLVNLLLNAADAIDEAERDGTVELTTRVVTVRPREVASRRRRRADDPEGIDYSHLRRLDQTMDPGPEPQLEEGETAVEISVRDDGPGIPPEVLPRVFEPFFTTKEPGRGTGLGLAVSARLIEGMGGTLEAVRDPAPGARFRILLPVARREGWQ